MADGGKEVKRRGEKRNGDKIEKRWYWRWVEMDERDRSTRQPTKHQCGWGREREGSWEERPEGRGEGGEGILYNMMMMMLFFSSQDIHTQVTQDTVAMGLMGRRKRKLSWERTKSVVVVVVVVVVAKLCVLSCIMPLWCQVLQSPVSRLQSALNSIWPVQLFFSLFTPSFLPYLTTSLTAALLSIISTVT